MIDDDPIAALRERIRSTAEAADRLAGEAGEEGAGGPWSQGAASDAAHEAQALASLVALLRDLLPDDLRQQIADLIRQVLLLVRAVIDYYLLRLEPGPGGAPAPAEPVVQDVPLD
ncbi:MAG: hypothetical protein JWM71_2386 [Solirubrobacteraceae bacterium]|nr:hypothetical protein [Solirubrobacteraceae bacterium]